MFISTRTTSWMKKAQPGNGQGQKPARMVGSESCTAFLRFKGTEARSVDEQGERAHGWALSFSSLSGILLLCAMTASTYAATKTADVRGLQHAKIKQIGMAERFHSKDEPTADELAAARGVEALLVDQMIQEMRKTVPDNDIIPVSQGEKIYRNMLDQEYSKIMSDSGMLGIADLVIAEMKGKK